MLIFVSLIIQISIIHAQVVPEPSKTSKIKQMIHKETHIMCSSTYSTLHPHNANTVIQLQVRTVWIITADCENNTSTTNYELISTAKLIQYKDYYSKRLLKSLK